MRRTRTITISRFTKDGDKRLPHKCLTSRAQPIYRDFRMSVNLYIVLWGLTLMILGQPLYFYSYFLKISVALCPPNPSELLNTARTSCLRATFGT